MTPFIVGVVVLKVAVGLQYCYLTLHKKKTPVLSTWMFLALATGMSFVTYLISGTDNFLNNIANLTDALMNTLILGCAIHVTHRWIATRFEQLIFSLGLIVIFIWLFTFQHLLANINIQILLTLAYLPMYVHLWKAKENTDSFLFWLALSISNALALIPALFAHDLIATIYAIRGTALTAITVLLILRLIVNRPALIKLTHKHFLH